MIASRPWKHAKRIEVLGQDQEGSTIQEVEVWVRSDDTSVIGSWSVIHWRLEVSIQDQWVPEGAKTNHNKHNFWRTYFFNFLTPELWGQNIKQKREKELWHEIYRGASHHWVSMQWDPDHKRPANWLSGEEGKAKTVSPQPWTPFITVEFLVLHHWES